MHRRDALRRLGGLGGGVGLPALTSLAGCAALPSSDGDDAGPTDADGPSRSGTAAATTENGATRTAHTGEVTRTDARLGLTYVRPTGNRVVGGRGSLPDATVRDVSLPGTPEWVVGAPGPEPGEVVWAVVFDDGRRVGLRSRGTAVSRIDLSGTGAGAGTGTGTGGPPALVVPSADGRSGSGGSDDVESGGPRLLAGRGSPLSHPLPVPGGVAFVRRDGTLSIRGETEADLPVGALPDARPVRSGGRLAVLGGRTDSYGHGVLGDGIEARTVAVVDPVRGRVVDRRRPPEGTVIEGIAPIVASLREGEAADTVVVASDAERGARLVAFGPDGGLAVGPPVGSGYRWRHALAVAPFGPGGEREVAVVRTPHLGGVAEFYRLDGPGTLSLVASREGGYATHRIGERNLDAALAGRFRARRTDRPGLLVPDGSGESLLLLERRSGSGERTGVVERAEIGLPGSLTTNLTGVGGVGGGSDGSRRGSDTVGASDADRVAVAAGTDAGLRLLFG